jgi:hypothetical protein
VVVGVVVPGVGAMKLVKCSKEAGRQGWREFIRSSVLCDTPGEEPSSAFSSTAAGRVPLVVMSIGSGLCRLPPQEVNVKSTRPQRDARASTCGYVPSRDRVRLLRMALLA